MLTPERLKRFGDSDLSFITLGESICHQCQYIEKDGMRCKAYPKGIPSDFIGGKRDHLSAEPDDGGIQFKKRAFLVEEELRKKRLLENEVCVLQRNQKVFNTIRKAIKSFEHNHEGDEKAWFNELCFCLLTANSNAKKVLQIWEELCQEVQPQSNAFIQFSLRELSSILNQKGYRFYNKRAEYIVEDRRLIGNLKAKVISFSNDFEAREWLTAEVKGFGLKESSHFLRNVGYKSLAILDRHILRILVDYRMIQKIPIQLSRRFYYSAEDKLRDFAQKMNLTLAELDLFLWYLKVGMILK